MGQTLPHFPWSGALGANQVIKSAAGLRNVQLLGKQDPYVKVWTSHTPKGYHCETVRNPFHSEEGAPPKKTLLKFLLQADLYSKFPETRLATQAPDMNSGKFATWNQNFTFPVTKQLRKQNLVRSSALGRSSAQRPLKGSLFPPLRR